MTFSLIVGFWGCGGSGGGEDEIIKDKVLVAAMVDRLTHKAYLVNMTGLSYRLKETQKMRQDK